MHTTKKGADFICIGAQKSATSWLYRQLSMHPDFDMPKPKELQYFSHRKRYDHKPPLYASRVVERLRNPQFREVMWSYLAPYIKGRKISELKAILPFLFATYSDDWYRGFFEHRNGFSGDISPSYATLDFMQVQAMARVVPEAKILMILRDPRDRAWSHFCFRVRRRLIDTSLMSAAQIERTAVEFLTSDLQIARSQYIRTLHHYCSHFSPKQIQIAFFDAIKESPKKLLGEVITYIGGDPKKIKTTDLERKVNSSPNLAQSRFIKIYLREMFQEEIAKLSEIFGGSCSAWNDGDADSFPATTVLSPRHRSQIAQAYIDLGYTH